MMLYSKIIAACPIESTGTHFVGRKKNFLMLNHMVMGFKNCVLKYKHVASTINMNVHEYLHTRHAIIIIIIIIIILKRMGKSNTYVPEC
jgi:hypothetical protein